MSLKQYQDMNFESLTTSNKVQGQRLTSHDSHCTIIGTSNFSPQNQFSPSQPALNKLARGDPTCRVMADGGLGDTGGSLAFYEDELTFAADTQGSQYDFNDFSLPGHSQTQTLTQVRVSILAWRCQW